MGKLLAATSDLERLHRAWRDVRAQVRRSRWPALAAELDAIDAAPIRALRSIRGRLRAGTYAFSPKWGYAKRKSGGSRRGITVHGVGDRIVQRAILDVLTGPDPALRARLGRIPAILDVPTSFAGIPGRGVPEAVGLAARAIRAGAVAFALSDMKDFFPRVPRADVAALVAENVDDSAFVALFRDALETEIRNLDDVRRWLDLFPIHEVGVAQGSLLSVLVGNLALRDFDVRMNRGDLLTIRYLDDFLILGPSRAAVAEGFRAAQAELARLGMECYEPGDGSQKAFLGRAADGFDFLGCRIHPDGIAPARRARRALLRGLSQAVAEAKGRILEARARDARRRAEPLYVQTLNRIDRTLRGWGDAYRFVTNRAAFAQVDAEVDRLLRGFQGWFARACGEAPAPSRRRMAGIALLGDTPPRPGEPDS
jgi:hypothetical protein